MPTFAGLRILLPAKFSKVQVPGSLEAMIVGDCYDIAAMSDSRHRKTTDRGRSRRYNRRHASRPSPDVFETIDLRSPDIHA